METHGRLMKVILIRVDVKKKTGIALGQEVGEGGTQDRLQTKQLL